MGECGNLEYEEKIRHAYYARAWPFTRKKSSATSKQTELADGTDVDGISVARRM